MNFYTKSDTISISATSKYIKDVQSHEEKNAAESPAQKNTYLPLFIKVSSAPDF
jgi:hypothetical protein